MMYPLVSELAADGIPVAVSLRVLKLARQPYYRWLQDPVSTADLEAAHRANALHAAHLNDPEFGYRLLRDEAEAAGERMAARTAWRLCRQAVRAAMGSPAASASSRSSRYPNSGSFR